MIGYFREPFVLSVIPRYFGYFRVFGHELKVLIFCSLSSFFVGSKAWYGLWHTSETVENYWIFNKDISEIPDPFWMYAKRRVYLKYRIIPIISGFLGFSKDFQNRLDLLSEKMLGSWSGSGTPWALPVYQWSSTALFPPKIRENKLEGYSIAASSGKHH